MRENSECLMHKSVLYRVLVRNLRKIGGVKNEKDFDKKVLEYSKRIQSGKKNSF